MIQDFPDGADRKINDDLDEEDMTSSMIEEYLDGLSYPAEKMDLLMRAKENEAPLNFLYVLSLFENKKYKSSIDVFEELSHIRG